MPVLKFVCRACGETFDELVRLGQTEGAPCPACGSADTIRRYAGKCPRRTGSSGERAGCACGRGGCAGCSGCSH